MIVSVGDVHVELVAWPTHAARAAELADRALPRLLLVDPVTDPPAPHDELEDWVRLPADDRDISVRVERLARIAGARSSTPPRQAPDLANVRHR